MAKAHQAGQRPVVRKGSAFEQQASGDERFCGFTRLGLQGVAAISRRVVQVQDHVRDGVVVERPEVRGQLEAPRADRASALERQIALVAKIELVKAAVVLGGARRDRLENPPIDDEPRVA